MKHIYPLKFNKWLYLLVPVVILLTVPVTVLTIINMVKMSSADGYNILLDIVVIVLSIAILLLSLSAIFFARYSVNKGSLYCSLGVFYNRIKIDSICGITHFTHLDKLAVFYKSGNFVKQIVVSIEKSQFDDFIDALRGVNPQIPYDVDSDDYDQR